MQTSVDFEECQRLQKIAKELRSLRVMLSLNQNEMGLLLLHATVIARYIQSDRVTIVILQAWVHRWKSYQQGGRTAGVQSVDRDLTEALTEVD